MNTDVKLKMKRTPKGKKPVYFDEMTDHLLNMVMALTSEVAVLRDRLDTVEQLSERGGVFKKLDIDDYSLSDDDVKNRSEWRAAFMGRIMKSIQDDINRMGERNEESAEIFEGAHTIS